MPRQLNIRSDRAVDLAHDLAHKLKKPVARVVEEALEAYGGETPEERLDRWKKMLAKGHKQDNGCGFEIEDMYDEIGLPK
ncbi:MAG TPA: type II toxin-antitoxin system VapB family antitoxin [Allosphingosinicella sp.]|jgi:hypothetical protein